MAQALVVIGLGQDHVDERPMILGIEVRPHIGHGDRSWPVARGSGTGRSSLRTTCGLVEPSDRQRDEMFAEFAVHADRAVAGEFQIVVLDPNLDLVVVSTRHGPRDGRLVLVDRPHPALGRVALASLEEEAVREGLHALSIEQTSDRAHGRLTATRDWLAVATVASSRRVPRQSLHATPRRGHEAVPSDPAP